MTAPTERNGISRRAALAKARQSRRPSRLGTPAGAALTPDHVLDDDAGFPGLLKRAWKQATAAPDLCTAVNTLLTLGGHVPADVQLRALRTTDELALTVLCGVSWREDHRHRLRAPDTEEQPAFLGELGLTTSGRVVVRVPSQRPLASEEDLVDGVMRVPWPSHALSDYQSQVSRAAIRFSRAVLPATDGADDGAIDGADVCNVRRPRRRGAGRGLVGGVAVWSSRWRGGGDHSAVTSATAVRVDFSSTMALSAAKAATRACTAMLLTARG